MKGSLCSWRGPFCLGEVVNKTVKLEGVARFNTQFFSENVAQPICSLTIYASIYICYIN